MMFEPPRLAVPRWHVCTRAEVHVRCPLVPMSRGLLGAEFPLTGAEPNLRIPSDSFCFPRVHPACPLHRLPSATLSSTPSRLAWHSGLGLTSHGPEWMGLPRGGYTVLTAAGPALELPSRPGGHDRRQRAPVARKPGVCRFSRSHEFPGPGGGGFGFVCLRRKSPWDTNCHFPHPPSPRRRLN